MRTYMSKFVNSLNIKRHLQFIIFSYDYTMTYTEFCLGGIMPPPEIQSKSLEMRTVLKFYSGRWTRLSGNRGDSDVGGIVMLVALWWWLISDVGGGIIMLATFSLCWWFSQCIKSVTNILNRSSTSQTCHQRIWSPTSVTNIDVTMVYYLSNTAIL